MAAPEDRKLAQDADVMSERNLSIIAAKGQEVIVVMVDGSRYVGFISGLDEVSLQLCLTADASLVLLTRLHVVAIEQTGYTLSQYEQENVEGILKVRDRIRIFQVVASHHTQNAK